MSVLHGQVLDSIGYYLDKIEQLVAYAHEDAMRNQDYLEPELEELRARLATLQQKLDFDAVLQKDAAALRDDVPNPDEGISTWISGETMEQRSQ